MRFYSFIFKRTVIFSRPILAVSYNRFDICLNYILVLGYGFFQHMRFINRAGGHRTTGYNFFPVIHAAMDLVAQLANTALTGDRRIRIRAADMLAVDFATAFNTIFGSFIKSFYQFLILLIQLDVVKFFMKNGDGA